VEPHGGCTYLLTRDKKELRKRAHALQKRANAPGAASQIRKDVLLANLKFKQNSLHVSRVVVDAAHVVQQGRFIGAALVFPQSVAKLPQLGVTSRAFIRLQPPADVAHRQSAVCCEKVPRRSPSYKFSS
jgi:hypothetical protein